MWRLKNGDRVKRPAAVVRELAEKATAPGPPTRGDGVPWEWIVLAVALAGLIAAWLRRRVPRLPRVARV